MANEIIREELKIRKVHQWELAAALEISEQTMVRRMRFEMDMAEQRKLLDVIADIAKSKEG